MNNTSPLDKINFKEITAQQVIAQLKRVGFNDVYETKDGVVKVNDLSTFVCEIKKDKNDIWQPQVSLEMLSLPVFIPAFILLFIAKVSRYDGILSLTVCAMTGYSIGSLIMRKKKNELESQIREGLTELNG